MRPTRWLIILVFIISLIVYGATCARTVTLVDSGELILACATLGVAHPPGFPVYTLIGHLFSKLPVGSVAFRLSVMSGCFAAAAAAFAGLIVAQLMAATETPTGPRGKRRTSANASKGTSSAAGQSSLSRTTLAALLPPSVGLTLAFSATLWRYATVAEVYSLNLALLAVTFWLLFTWRRAYQQERERAWPVVIAGLSYGLALGVHHVTVILTLPAIVVLVWRTAGWRYIRSRPARWAIAMMLMGLSSYVYLPLAAAHHPPLNWGDPSNWERFWWHISARQYQVNLFSGNVAVVWENLVAFLRLLVHEFTPVGLALAPLGLAWLWRRDRTGAWFVLLLMALNIGYAINYEIAEDTDAYYLPTFLALTLVLAAGWRWLWERIGNRPTPWARILSALMIVLPTINLTAHYRQNDRHDDQIARHYVEDALAGVKPGGLLMTLDWQLYSPFLYLHHIEGFRPDVTVVDVNLVRRSWYVRTYLDRFYPEMMAACRAERDAFMEKLRLFEHDEPYDPKEITARFTALLNAFIAYHLPEREVHLTIPMEPNVGTRYNWIPYGLTFRLHEDRRVHLDPPPALHLEPLLVEPERLDEVARKKIRPQYALMLANRGRYLAAAHRYDEALERLAWAMKLMPESDLIRQFIGDVELARGHRQAARAAYREALRLNPSNRIALQRLRELGP